MQARSLNLRPLAGRCPTLLSRTPLRQCAATRLLSSSAKDPQYFGDHSWRQQNHIWTENEVQDRMKTFDMKHVPQNTADSVLQKMVRVAYHGFNFVTGYDHADPPTSAIGYSSSSRLLVCRACSAACSGTSARCASSRGI